MPSISKYRGGYRAQVFVQRVHDDTDPVGLGIALYETLHHLGKFELGSMFGALARERLAKKQNLGGPVTDILSVFLAVLKVQNIIQLAKEVATDAARYPSAHKVTLSGSSQWSDSASTPRSSTASAGRGFQERGELIFALRQSSTGTIRDMVQNLKIAPLKTFKLPKS